MTLRNKAISKMISDGDLKEYDVINLGYIGFYLKYGRKIVTHNIAPTLITKSDLVVVVKE